MDIIKKVFKKIIYTFGKIRFRTTLKIYLKKKLKCKKDSPLVLIWELGGFPGILRKNAILSLAFNVRGYNTHFIICDGVAEICIQSEIAENEKSKNWYKRCRRCLKDMKSMAQQYCVNYSVAGDYIDKEYKKKFKEISETIGIREIRDYKYLGINVGEYALASHLRYNKGYPVDYSSMTKENEIIHRKYFYGSLINTYIADQAIKKHKPVSVFTSHGVYIDYAPPMFLAFSRGINTMSWISGFKNFSHYYSKPRNVDEFLFRQISKNEWERRVQRPLSQEENGRLDEFMKNRYFGNRSSDISFSHKPDEASILKRKLEIDNDNSVICLFTHLNWDACVGFSTMIFEDSDKWVIESINKMIELKNVNWIIKIHPGERIHGNVYSVGDNIKRVFKHIPEHIKILWPDSDINTYGLYQLINAGITIFGTVGVELPLFGKPIITAGEAHFSGKGFSIDARTKEEYFSILENAKNIKSLTEEQVKIARQYAYSCFIQRQIPLNIINKSEGHWGNIDLRRLNELLPGNDPVLDIICDGIVNGKDVILDEKVLDKLYRETNGCRK